MQQKIIINKTSSTVLAQLAYVQRNEMNNEMRSQRSEEGVTKPLIKLINFFQASF